MGILRAMRSKVVCLVVGHDWSDWEVPDPDRPSEQIKICARCSRTKTNAPPAPLEAWKMPLN